MGRILFVFVFLSSVSLSESDSLNQLQTDSLQSVKEASQVGDSLIAADFLLGKFSLGADGKPQWAFAPYPSASQMSGAESIKPLFRVIKPESKASVVLAPFLRVFRKRGKTCEPNESILLNPPLLSFETKEQLSGRDFCLEDAESFSLDESHLGSLQNNATPGREQKAFISILGRESLNDAQKAQFMSDRTATFQTILASLPDEEKQKLVQPTEVLFLSYVPHPEHPQAVGAVTAQVGNIAVKVPVSLPPQPKCRITRITPGNIEPSDRVEFKLEVDSVTREGSSVFDFPINEQNIPEEALHRSNSAEYGTFTEIHRFSLKAVASAESRKIGPRLVAWDVFAKVRGVRSDLGFYRENPLDDFSCQLQVPVDFSPPLCTLDAAQKNILAGETTQVTLDCRDGGPITSAKIEGFSVESGTSIILRAPANATGMLTGIRVQKGETVKFQTTGQIQYVSGGSPNALFTGANGVAPGQDLPQCKYPALNPLYRSNYLNVVDAIPSDCRFRINTGFIPTSPDDPCVTQIRALCSAQNFVSGTWPNGTGLGAHCLDPILAGILNPDEVTYGRNFPTGALLGQWERGAPFFLIGTEREVKADRDGNLRLFVNDSVCSNDNKESFSVFITRPPTEGSPTFSKTKLATVTLPRSESVNVQTISAEVTGPDGTVRPNTFLGKVCDFNNPNYQAPVFAKNQWAVEAGRKGKISFSNEDPLAFSRNWLKVSEPYTTPVRAYLMPGQTLQSNQKLKVNGDLMKNWAKGDWGANLENACVPGTVCDPNNKCRFELVMKNNGKLALENEWFWVGSTYGADRISSMDGVRPSDAPAEVSRFAQNTGSNGAVLKMQESGNLVLLNAQGNQVLWESGTVGSGNKLELRGSGWLGITDSNGAVKKELFQGDAACNELPQNRYNFSWQAGDWGGRHESWERDAAGFDMDFQACNTPGESNICMTSFFAEPVPLVDKDVRLATMYYPSEDKYYRQLAGYGSFWIAVDARDPACALTKIAARTGGCFSEKTRLQMADGKEKLISEVRENDYVWNPHYQMGVRVRKVVKGPEKKSLYEVQIGQNKVEVTEDHPFLTQRGWVQARNLASGDRLMGQGAGKVIGNVKRLKYVGPKEVWNFELDSDDPLARVVVANGIPTGELSLQTELKKGNATDLKP
ncbi:MAG: hypothetical protein ACKN9V_08300 [Pseudomonadota bacterium]